MTFFRCLYKMQKSALDTRRKEFLWTITIEMLNDMFAFVITGGRQRHTYVSGGAIWYDAIRAEQIEQARKYFHLFRSAIMGSNERRRTPWRRIDRRCAQSWSLSRSWVSGRFTTRGERWASFYSVFFSVEIS